MEIHLKINLKMENMFSFFPQARANRDIRLRLNAISCSGAKWATVKGNKPNHYEVLSLGSKNVGFDDIKKAYRALALRYHPDLCSPLAKEDSIKRFIELKEAYETLSDPVSKRIYDYELSLVESLEFSGICIGQRSCFPKEVWERQLKGLRNRSYNRTEKPKMTRV